jgi:hypothetical protein
MGIYELLVINDELRELILERATTDEIQESALRAGMISMRQDGWLKICMGLTTFAEVARQTPRDAPASSSKMSAGQLGQAAPAKEEQEEEERPVAKPAATPATAQAKSQDGPVDSSEAAALVEDQRQA